MTQCLACNGDKFRHRLVPHPHIPGKQVTVTRICEYCAGKGTVKEYVPCGKDRAANDTEEKDS